MEYTFGKHPKMMTTVQVILGLSVLYLSLLLLSIPSCETEEAGCDPSCQNNASCQQNKCQCGTSFVGQSCEVNVS